MTVYRTYEEAEADLWEMADMIVAVAREAEARVAEHYREVFGWAPGDEVPRLPEPPEPVIWFPDVGVAYLPEPPEYMEPEPYVPLDLVAPALDQQSTWLPLMGARLDGNLPDYDLECVPNLDMLTHLNNMAQEWALEKMTKDTGYRMTPEGTLEETNQSYRFLGRVTHWQNSGAWWQVIYNVAKVDMDQESGDERDATLRLWLALEELNRDTNGEMDEYFLEYQLAKTETERA